MSTVQAAINVRYAAVGDSAVAFATIGSGPPLVIPAMGPLRLLQIERRIKSWRDWYGELAQASTVIRYDGRGTGLSSGPTDFSLSSRVADLEAVTDSLDWASYDLLALPPSGPSAIAFAAMHPDKVKRLILWCSYDRGADYFGSRAARRFQRLIENDWSQYTETVVRQRLGATGVLAKQLIAILRSSFSPAVQRHFVDQGFVTDVSHMLGDVRAPTLVVHRLQLPFPPVDVAHRMGATIPDAHVLLLEGNTAAPFIGGDDSVEIVNRFLGRRTESFWGTATALETLTATDWLTYRERDVLRLIAEGQANRAIAETLLISLHTVKSHVQHITSKLNVSSRTAAIAAAQDLNLLS